MIRLIPILTLLSIASASAPAPSGPDNAAAAAAARPVRHKHGDLVGSKYTARDAVALKRYAAAMAPGLTRDALAAMVGGWHEEDGGYKADVAARRAAVEKMDASQKLIWKQFRRAERQLVGETVDGKALLPDAEVPVWRSTRRGYLREFPTKSYSQRTELLNQWTRAAEELVNQFHQRAAPTAAKQ